MSESSPIGDSPGSSAEEPTTSGLRQFLGLFVVPLLVVLMCVSVFLLFGWVAYDRQSVGDYLNDLRDGRSFFAHRRKQASYELSKILSANPDALREVRGAEGELRTLFETTDDLWVRRYLALVMGHIGDKEAVPLLIEAAADEDSQTRIYSLWALGSIADPRGLETVTTAVSDSDAGIRKTAAFALGRFGDPSSSSKLAALVNDPVADVRWNAALALANLGSRDGVDVLEQMLDRRLLGQVPGITPKQQEEAMIGALGAFVRLGGGVDSGIIDVLANEDPSLKVRQAAIEARRSLQSG